MGGAVHEGVLQGGAVQPGVRQVFARTGCSAAWSCLEGRSRGRSGKFHITPSRGVSRRGTAAKGLAASTNASKEKVV